MIKSKGETGFVKILGAGWFVICVDRRNYYLFAKAGLFGFEQAARQWLTYGAFVRRFLDCGGFFARLSEDIVPAGSHVGRDFGQCCCGGVFWVRHRIPDITTDVYHNRCHD